MTFYEHDKPIQICLEILLFNDFMCIMYIVYYEKNIFRQNGSLCSLRFPRQLDDILVAPRRVCKLPLSSLCESFRGQAGRLGLVGQFGLTAVCLETRNSEVVL